MSTKRCNKCKQELDISFFSKKGFYADGSQKYQPWCRSCQKQYKDQHYLDNKDKYKAKAHDHRDRMMAFVVSIKESTPCADCGKKYPACVMDFDHLPGYEKVENVSQLVRHARSKAVIEEEMSKCELVCSNCHRIRTWITRSSPA